MGSIKTHEVVLNTNGESGIVAEVLPNNKCKVLWFSGRVTVEDCVKLIRS